MREVAPAGRRLSRAQLTDGDAPSRGPGSLDIWGEGSDSVVSALVSGGHGTRTVAVGDRPSISLGERRVNSCRAVGRTCGEPVCELRAAATAAQRPRAARAAVRAAGVQVGAAVRSRRDRVTRCVDRAPGGRSKSSGRVPLRRSWLGEDDLAGWLGRARRGRSPGCTSTRRTTIRSSCSTYFAVQPRVPARLRDLARRRCRPHPPRGRRAGGLGPRAVLVRHSDGGGNGSRTGRLRARRRRRC